MTMFAQHMRAVFDSLRWSLCLLLSWIHHHYRHHRLW